MSKFPSLSDIVTTTLRNQSASLAVNLSKNNSALQRLTKAYEWKAVWEKAVANMPWIEAGRCGHGQLVTLARCLGIPIRHVARGQLEGKVPKNPEFEAKLKGYCRVIWHPASSH